MNIYLLLYITSSLIMLLSGILIWKKLQNISGIFFFIYALTSSIWFLLYFIFFSGILHDKDQYLLLSRLSFGLSIICVYSLLFFTAYFGKNSVTKGERDIAVSVGIIFCIVFIYTGFSPLIVSGLRIEENTGLYREIMGTLFPIHLVGYIIFPILLIGTFFWKVKQLNGITKIRFIHTSLAGALFMLILIILQVILPYMNIWILERELVILSDAYIIYVSYITSRYYFRSIWYDIAKILSITISIGAGIIMSFFNSGIELFPETNSGLWQSRDTYKITSFLLGLGGFSLCYKASLSIIFGKIFENSLSRRILELERIISKIMNLEEINCIIKKEMQGIFQIYFSEIISIPENEKYTHPLSIYFKYNTDFPLFINDPSFIEEQERGKNLSLIKQYIPKEALIAIPLYGKNKSLIGLMLIGGKRKGNFFDTYEVEQLKNFSDFLSHHIQYLETYNKLEDISHNLDRKIDEKTIEYNTLISRQREFIATLSHEIKAPITSTLLQLDNLSVDVESGDLSQTQIQEELISIGDNLSHAKTLLAQIFSTEYLEKQKSILYPEKVDIIELVLSQYHIQKRIHHHCIYTESIPKQKIFINIDKTQFIQVLTNLFGNAIKFAHPKNPEIHLDITITESDIIIRIEDNGSGLHGINLDQIFEKYSIGKNSIGLGIGLYLCKRIVELHNGVIRAKKGAILHGICMEITLPRDTL